MQRTGRINTPRVLLPVVVATLLVVQPFTAYAQFSAGSPANSPVQPPNVFVVALSPPPPPPDQPPPSQPPPPASPPPASPPPSALQSPPPTGATTPGLVNVAAISSPPPASRSPPPPSGSFGLSALAASPPVVDTTATGASPPQQSPVPSQHAPPAMPPEPPPPSPPSPASPGQPASTGSTTFSQTGFFSSPPPAAQSTFAPGILLASSGPPPASGRNGTTSSPPPMSRAASPAGSPGIIGTPGVVSPPTQAATQTIKASPAVAPAARTAGSPPPPRESPPPPRVPAPPPVSVRAIVAPVPSPLKRETAAAPQPSPSQTLAAHVLSPAQTVAVTVPSPPAAAPVASDVQTVVAPVPSPPAAAPVASHVQTIVAPLPSAAPVASPAQTVAVPVPSPAVAAPVASPVQTVTAPVPSPAVAAPVASPVQTVAPVPSPQDFIAAPLANLALPATVPTPSAEQQIASPAMVPTPSPGQQQESASSAASPSTATAPAPAPVSSAEATGFTQLPVQQQTPAAAPDLSPTALFAAPVRAHAIDRQGGPVQSFSVAPAAVHTGTSPSPSLNAAGNGSAHTPSVQRAAPAPVPVAEAPTNVQSLVDGLRRSTSPGQAPSPGAPVPGESLSPATAQASPGPGPGLDALLALQPSPSVPSAGPSASPQPSGLLASCLQAQAQGLLSNALAASLCNGVLAPAASPALTLASPGPQPAAASSASGVSPVSAPVPKPGAASLPVHAPEPSMSPAKSPVAVLPRAPAPAPGSRAPSPGPRELPVLAPGPVPRAPTPAPHRAPIPAPVFAPARQPISRPDFASGPMTSLTPFLAPLVSPVLLGTPAPSLVEQVIPFTYGPNLAPAPGVPSFLWDAMQITPTLFYTQTQNNLGFYQVTRNTDGTTVVTPAFSTLPAGYNSSDITKINVTFQFLGPNIFPFNASAQAALLSVLNDTFTAANITHEVAVTSLQPIYGSSASTPTAAITVPAQSPQGRRLLQTVSATLEVSANNVLVNVTVAVPVADQYNVRQLAQDAINSKEFRDNLAAAGYELTTAKVVAVVSINTGKDVSVAPAPPSNNAVPTPKSSSTSIGAIAGGAAGGALALMAVGAFLLYKCNTRRKRAALEEEARRCKMSDVEDDSPYGMGANRRPMYEDADGRAQVFTNGAHKTNGYGKYPNGAGVYNSNDSSLEMGPISEDGVARPHRLKAAKGPMGSQEINLLGDPSSQGSPMSAMAHSIEPNGTSSGGSNLERDPHLAMLKNQPDSFRVDQQHARMMERINGSTNLDSESARSGSSSRIDANLWQVAWKDMSMQKQIGEGSFGKVYLAKWRETTVAVKVLTGGNIQDDDAAFAAIPSHVMKSLEKEASMMAAMRHPNVVMYLGVCLEPPAVLTEFCARGSLNDVLKKALTKADLASQLDWTRRLGMALDAAKGMNYLHSSDPPVIHRDLKSPNLLVDKHWRVKVCDFNLSRVMEETAVLSSMAASNPRWLAPEILSGRGYTFSSDIYSFGVILWEFMTWRVPWHECGPWQVVALVTEHGQRPDIPAPAEIAGCSFTGYDEYVELIKQCWDQDAEARPNFNDIIKVLRRLLQNEINSRKGLVRRGSLSSQGSVPTDLMKSDIMRSGVMEEVTTDGIAEAGDSSASNSHEKTSEKDL